MSKAFNSINGANWFETVDQDYLKGVRNPSLGNRHLPINHGDVLEMFQMKAQAQGMTLGDASGYLSPEQDKFIYVAEVNANIHMTFAIGFINFNDRSRSFTGLAGEKVFTCSNCQFGGVFAPSKTRHTLNVEDRLDTKVDAIFDQYNAYEAELKKEQGFLTETQIDDAKLGKVLVEMGREKVFGATNIMRIIEEYDKPTFNDGDAPANGWRLNNAVTHTLKKIKNPIQNIDSGNHARQVILKVLGY